MKKGEEMKKLRIGIIGAGGIAQGRHIPAFLKLHEYCTLRKRCKYHKLLMQFMKVIIYI